MHVVLGLLGTVVTILILLNRLADAGIDLGGLNPFLWHRRRQWRKKTEGNPAYHIQGPLDLTALLMVAIAKCEGDISKEEKRTILQLFTEEFHLSKREAAALMGSSTYLLQDGQEVRAHLAKVLAPSLGKFTEPQRESALSLIERVAHSAGGPSEIQKEYLAEIRSLLAPRPADQHTWG
jgi:uncharacterized tellurite resistance protein B-like protein